MPLNIYLVTFPHWSPSQVGKVNIYSSGIGLHESLEKQQITPNRGFLNFLTPRDYFLYPCVLLELHQDLLSAGTVYKKAAL